MCQTISWVQFDYDLHMPNYTLGNINIRYGLAVTPDKCLVPDLAPTQHIIGIMGKCSPTWLVVTGWGKERRRGKIQVLLLKCQSLILKFPNLYLKWIALLDLLVNYRLMRFWKSIYFVRIHSHRVHG